MLQIPEHTVKISRFFKIQLKRSRNTSHSRGAVRPPIKPII